MLLVPIFAGLLAFVWIPFSLLSLRAWHQTEHFLDKKMENLLVLEFSEMEKIDWEKPGKEFRYAGKMYDVKSIDSSNHKLRIHAFEDSHENKLLELLSVDGFDQNNKTGHTMNSRFPDLCYPPTFPEKPENPSEILPLCFIVILNPSEGFGQSEDPPPEHCTPFPAYEWAGFGHPSKT